MTRTVETRDGRTLEVHEDGDPSGLAVICHHGTPMSGIAYEPHVELAREQGIRLIGYDRPGYEGMGEGNHIEFGKAVEGEEALRTFCEPEAEEMKNATPEALAEVMESLLGPKDRAVLTGRFAAFMVESARRGLASSVDGWIDDDFAFLEPWGFDLAEIATPVLLLHGEDDRFVPVSHARWLAERIPGVEARIDPDDGHLTLLERRMREVNEWLLSHG